MIGRLVHSKVPLSEAAPLLQDSLAFSMDGAFTHIAKGGEDGSYTSMRVMHERKAGLRKRAINPRATGAMKLGNFFLKQQ